MLKIPQPRPWAWSQALEKLYCSGKGLEVAAQALEKHVCSGKGLEVAAQALETDIDSTISTLEGEVWENTVCSFSCLGKLGT